MDKNSIPQVLQSRFWSKVDIKSTDECWNWKAGKIKDGYGRIKLMRQNWSSHRLAWALTYGDPQELCVLHDCDNPACCNPKHLFLGTHADNNHDKERKQRGNHAKREHNGAHKLTAVQVQEIRRRYAAGTISQTTLSREYKVSQATISSIVLNKTWGL